MLPIKIHSPRWLSKFQTWLGHLVFLWKSWDLRTLILLSLFLQVFLILFAPFRKKTGNFVVVSSIWLAYLGADYVAIQAVSLIPKYSTTHAAATPHPDLLAFWAPFLLVHLGGPDPITALALEDNELWLRTILHLFASVYATGRVFFQSVATNDLFVPSALMFFAGFFKYLERALSMYYAHLDKFRTSHQQESSNPRLQVLAAAIGRVKDLGGHSRGQVNERAQTLGKKMGRLAAMFFKTYKLLYVDLTLNVDNWIASRYIFQLPSMTAEKAFMVVEMELNFAYEAFYTKMIVIHKKFGIIMRHTSFLFQIVSLVVWILFIDKKAFHKLDIGITYTLLVGAVVIESVAFLMVALSDWQMRMVTEEHKVRTFLYAKVLSARSRTWGIYWGPKECPLWPWIRRLIFRRWSESVYQFNAIHYPIPPESCFYNLLHLIKEQCGRLSYVSNKWFTNGLRDFIFNEIKCKSESAQDLKDTEKMCDSRGEWVLNSLETTLNMGLDLSAFNQWITEVKYEECLMIWHIATELLYQTASLMAESDYPKFCKTLSDYMMYLLCWQPGMVFSATGNITSIDFRDISSTLDKEIKKMYKVHNAMAPERKRRGGYQFLIDLSAASMPVYRKSEISKTLVYEGVRLAKELKKLEKHEPIGMWEVMAKVWVELMCYSATNCKASIHAAQLKQGGELLTLVWLLMVHFGLSKLYRI